MNIREVITELIKYPMEAELMICSNGQYKVVTDIEVTKNAFCPDDLFPDIETEYTYNLDQGEEHKVTGVSLE